MGLVDQVGEYFEALIVGVILLYILYELVKALFSDSPLLSQYGIPIVIASAVALLVIAKRGIEG